MDIFLNTRSSLSVLIIILSVWNNAAKAASELPENRIETLSSQAASQIERDKIRKQRLQATLPDTRSSREEENKAILHFPQERPCYPVDKVKWTQDSPQLKLASLNNFTRQAEGQCLGIKGIRLLASTLQNEIIRLGYITTRIDMPAQDLHRRTLQFDIKAGKVGKIKLVKGSSDYINLRNTLPFGEGDLLNLSELEQGSFNLQRTPGATVKIQVVPGEEKGESDILINRHQDKYWQVGAWLNDAGSKSTGRYQAGGAIYLHNATSLSDTLFFSMGQDISTRHKPEGSRNRALGYSLPWGFWSLDLYASQSRYHQHIQGSYADWMLNNKNSYYSAQLNRLLSHTVHQKTTAGLQLYRAATRYYFDDYELSSMHKKSAGWKLLLSHQRYFDRAAVAATLSYQNNMPWFGSDDTLEKKSGLVDKRGRIIVLDVKAAVNFSLFDEKFNYSPYLNIQLSPDSLSSLDRLALGNRWNVRGFDGEYSLQDNQGWFLRNDISWIKDGKHYQPYIGLDIGQAIGHSSQQYYSGKTLAGGVAGVQGDLWQTHYDLFAGLPLYQPQAFHTDPLTLGFSLQWKY